MWIKLRFSFIAQGANDPRVVKSESDQIVEALKSEGIEVPYMVKEDEDMGSIIRKINLIFTGRWKNF